MSARYRPRGIALVLTLVVMLLLTAYMNEFFFSTGLELRAMRTAKDALQARGLARLAFKALQVGMLSDELVFFRNFSTLKKVLGYGSIPWEEGLLVEVEVHPQDALFNLNELDIKDNSPADHARWNLFANIMADVQVPAAQSELPPEPLSEQKTAELYAALVDWIDGGSNASYQGVSGGVGAEQASYISDEPEVQVKNGQLDRLRELRLVNGVLTSGMRWEQWKERFAVLPKSGGSDLYAERLNVNTASREDIQVFLEQRQLAGIDLGATWNAVQESINTYADNAVDIAAALVPEDAPRPIYTQSNLEQILPQNLNPSTTQELFSFANEYYRIRIVTAFADVQAQLEGLLYIPRNSKRVGGSAQVLYMNLR